MRCLLLSESILVCLLLIFALQDMLLADLTKDLSHWQSALTELQASFKDTI